MTAAASCTESAKAAECVDWTSDMALLVGLDRDALPRSVRGAPPELRRLIRKKQNAESARRCRLKLRLERQREAARNAPRPVAERLQQLAMQVTTLQARLSATEASYSALLARAAALSASSRTIAINPVRVGQPRPRSPPAIAQVAPISDPLEPQQIIKPPTSVAPEQEDTTLVPEGDGCDAPTSPTAVNLLYYGVEQSARERDEFAFAVDELALL